MPNMNVINMIKEFCNLKESFFGYNRILLGMGFFTRKEHIIKIVCVAHLEQNTNSFLFFF